MEKNIPKIVYSPDSQLSSISTLLKSMFSDLKSCRFLAWRFFVRNLSAQYRQTFLGYIWIFLPPLATTAVWIFLNSQKIINIPQTNLPYPVYVLTGTLLWQGFVDALNSPIQLVNGSKHMLTKIKFPHEALIMAGLATVLFNFLVRFILMIGVYFWAGISFHVNMLLAPFGILSLLFLGLVAGVLFLPFSMLYGDVQRFIGMMTSFWFFITPIVYPVPTVWPASLIVKLNPVSPMLVASRQWLTGGEASDPFMFIVVLCSSIFLGFLGWLFYRLAMPHLIERIGA
jgi:lipopolysaccharide transport system permease protein